MFDKYVLFDQTHQIDIEFLWNYDPKKVGLYLKQVQLNLHF